MKKLFVLAFALFLGACSVTTLSVKNPVNTNQLATLEATYGVLLSAAVNYRKLPLCENGQHASVSNVCAERSVIVELQKADKVVQVALVTVRNLIKNNPTIDPTDAITALKGAIDTFKSVELNYGVKI